MVVKHVRCCSSVLVLLLLLLLAVGPRVLLEVVLAAESLAAARARVRSESRVDPAVASQLLVARERLAAAVVVALERTLTWMKGDSNDTLFRINGSFFFYDHGLIVDNS
jgi:hypothetical protein